MTRRVVRTLAAVAALWFAAQLLLQPAAQAQVVDANDTSSDTENFTQTNSTVDNDGDNCYTKPCGPGVCEDLLNSYRCICPPNYNGTHCENDLASLYGCAIEPCQNQGTCQDLPGSDQTGRKFKCLCPDGYTGMICETMIDLCRTQPCQNGVCSSGPNNYTCNCTGTGFKGTNCSEDIDECEASMKPCGDLDVKCFNEPGGFTCDCPAGYDGTPCVQVNECVTRPCKNGATCIDGVNQYTCQCVEGYTGPKCEVNIDECLPGFCTAPNSRCKDLVNGYVCECEEGFDGNPSTTCSDINECLPLPSGRCLNGANCTNHVGSYNCSCMPGFSGHDCEIDIDDCDPDPCHNNATCLDGVAAYTCDCLPGYSGPKCEQNIDECVNNDCRNGANCTDLINAFKCECVAGWTGDRCETDIDECNPSPCINGVCEDRLNEFYCACPAGFTGLTCESNINDCDPDPCQNNGTCLDGINNYRCECNSDWMGQNCTEVYNECAFRPCKNGGNCTSEPRVKAFECACPTGFNGTACEINIDDCALAGANPCKSYEICRDGVNNYTCGCPIGYGGFQCSEEINECDAKPCKNGGNCTDGLGNYTCTCRQTIIDITSIIGPKGKFVAGYTGQNCEEDINECELYKDPPICQSNGKCENLAGYFECYCRNPFEDGQGFNVGSLCESSISYCDMRRLDQQCQNGATCVVVKLGSECQCAPGYEGGLCEIDIDECLSNPCQHNGTCLDQVNNYTCTCQPGWTGQQCEIDIDDCEVNPCLNKGICRDGINSFSCNCTDTGFEGDTCSIDIDDCVDDPCANNGTCQDKVKGFTCDCLPAYKGPNCQTDIPDCDPSPCLHGSSCKERSNIDLYGKGDPEFVTFTYAGAAGYVCECAEGVKGVNCSEDVDECEDPVNTPCQNGATCVNTFQNYSCSCVPGYMGQHCETEIDECQILQPCKNGGNCTDLINDYNCSCPAATVHGSSYAGKNCTTYLSGCDSPPRICGPGDCLPRLLESPPFHSYTCLCPEGYRGTNCGATTDFSFTHGTGDGYIRNDMTSSDGKAELSLSFRTTLSDALLILAEVEGESNAFISVELIDGRLQMRYKTSLQDPMTVAQTISRVNDSRYHHLTFTVFEGINMSMPSEACRGSKSSNSDLERCQVPKNFGELNDVRVSWLFIGSKMFSQFKGNSGLPSAFIGCMQDVELNGKWIYPGQKTGDYYDVSRGCSRREQCLTGVCNYHGECVDLWDKFQCNCVRPYQGDTCNKEYPAATFKMGASVSVQYGVIGPGVVVDTAELSFFLTTRQSDGFLAYFSNPGSLDMNRISFMGLYLQNGRLAGDFFNCKVMLRFDTSESSSATSLNDGEPHLIVISLKPSQFHLLVDGKLLFENATLPNSENNCEQNFGLVVSDLYIGKPPPVSSDRGKRDLSVLSRQKRQTDLSVTVDQVKQSYQLMSSFEGVIQDVRVNGNSLEFSSATATGIVQGKANTRDVCQDLNPCDQATNCTNTYFNDYTCECLFGYRGKNCSEPDFCSFGTCPEESSCVNLRNGYECVGVATFFQDSSLISYTMSEELVNASSGSDLDLTFMMRTRGRYGLIFQMRQGPYHMSLQIVKGHLEVNYKLKAGEYEFSKSVATKEQKKVNDGKWYYVRLQVMNSTHFQLQVHVGSDDTPMVHTSSTSIGSTQPETKLLDSIDAVEFSPRDPEVDLLAVLLASGKGSELLLGGSDAARSSTQWEAAFNGCLWGARIGGTLLPFYIDGTFLNNSNTERFLVQKKEAVTHDCSGQNQCGMGGPGYRYCGNGGRCVDEWNAFSCQCQLGFEGLQCEINPDSCTDHECLNQATCLDGDGDYTCLCMPGFSGDRCQTAVDQCQGHLCENGGVCVDRGYDYTCNCSSALGYTGWYCNVTLNQTCADNPCQNGASCSIVGSSFECSSCSSLYEGPLCENQRDVCGVNNYTLCQNGGTCRLDASKTEGYRCECDPDRDFEGTTCSSKIEDCQNINCNNGVCKDGVRNYTCLCNTGWRGGQCDQKIDSCNANRPYCQHGTCINQTCQCDPFYQGEGCDEDKNECELDEPVCKNGGSCTNKEGGFNCNCTIGFRGNTCSEAFCDTQCYNGSTCSVDSGAQNWTCACPEYVEGRFCETQGPCFARPCDQIKTETCDQSIEKDTFTCNCKKGWEGNKCQDDLNECTTTDSAQKHMCVDGQGVCNNTQGSYTCDCVPGFTGKYCQTDIDDCTPNPCLHGGRCTDLVNNFTCDCLRTGYEGLTCESDVNECKSSPPVCNHGNCSNTVPGFNCVCGDRWRGQFCQRENPCYNISCQHGGTCQENVTLIEDRCACVAGYEGALCEKASASTDDSGPDLGVIIGPIVGGVVLLIIIIVLIAFFMTARSKRATRGAYSPSAQENAGSQVEQGGVLKKPPEERLI